MLMKCGVLKIFVVLSLVVGLQVSLTIGSPPTLPNSQFAVVLYNDDGSLDRDFGDDGIVLTNFRSARSGGAMAIFYAPYLYAGPNGWEGNIVVGGDALVGDGHQFALARYKEDGTLEERFDGDGKVLTNFRSARSESALDIALSAHCRRVVAAGKALVGDGYQFALARYYWSGGLDTAFDGDGKVLTNFSSATDEVIRAIAISCPGSNISHEACQVGKIVVAGDAFIHDGRQIALARYNWDGSLDTSFDGDGKVLTDFPSVRFEYAEDIALTMIDGELKVVLAGGAFVDDAYQIALARYNWDGSLDTSFDGDGMVLTDFPSSSDERAYAIAISGVYSDRNYWPYFSEPREDEVSKIVVAGRAWVGTWQFALARYNEDGSLDTSFDGDGMVLTDLPDTRHEIARSINVWRESLYVAGEAGGG